MKLRWKGIVAACAVLMFAGAAIWRFDAELKARRLVKDAAACRVLAEQGDAKAQFSLGSMYANGQGVQQDFVEAVRWYRKSAEQGNAKAEYDLCHMYHKGKGVPQDKAEARRWCLKAAAQNDVRAQDALGFMYLHGEEVPQDYSQAAEWYRKSAAQNFADAQYSLGYMYYNGYGVPQDRVEAYRLFREAAARGNEQARHALGPQTRISLTSKIALGAKLLGAVYFGVIFLKAGKSFRTREQITLGTTVLLLVLALALDLLWYFYAGHLHASAIVSGVYVARHLVNGMIVATLASIAHPGSARVVLVAAAVLFVAFIVLDVVLEGLRHMPLEIWFRCFVGFPIGMAIPSFILLRVNNKNRQSDTGVVTGEASGK